MTDFVAHVFRDNAQRRSPHQETWTDVFRIHGTNQPETAIHSLSVETVDLKIEAGCAGAAEARQIVPFHTSEAPEQSSSILASVISISSSRTGVAGLARAVGNGWTAARSAPVHGGRPHSPGAPSRPGNIRSFLARNVTSGKLKRDAPRRLKRSAGPRTVGLSPRQSLAQQLPHHFGQARRSCIKGTLRIQAAPISGVTRAQIWRDLKSRPSSLILALHARKPGRRSDPLVRSMEPRSHSWPAKYFQVIDGAMISNPLTLRRDRRFKN